MTAKCVEQETHKERPSHYNNQRESEAGRRCTIHPDTPAYYDADDQSSSVGDQTATESEPGGKTCGP
jgi:hypothetical protein